MKRSAQLASALLIVGLSLVVSQRVSPTFVITITGEAREDAEGLASEPESTRSWPQDTTNSFREPLAEDYAPAGITAMGAETLGIAPAIFMVDVVVNNTDPTLADTDTFVDWENSIAVNTEDPDEIVILGFSGSWGANAPLWHSTDGGLTWTKEFTIPSPPGLPLGCPCDQTLDYGRNDELSVTFLANSPAGIDVVSGTTIDPADATAWNWLVIAGVTQLTNNGAPGSIGNADQPWLIVNPDPFNPNQDNVYVAYDDFNNTDGIDGPDMRVAVSYGVNPPDFTVDVQTGNSTGGVNPGHRLASDPRTGYVYSLFGRCVSNCGGDPKNIDYMLNRSTDGGATWSLNGTAFGIVVANADSTQPRPKFGTVNALLGNVLHGAVDPITGDFYYVYGNRDPTTGNDRLAIRRIVSDGAGGVIIGSEFFVTGQVEAALPQVAVTDNGTVGVFYYTFDGFSSDDFPIFSAHLALSEDQGVTFTTYRLLTFLSQAKDNGNNRQRLLGDYEQMKTVGNCFYGTFTANGVPFGRPIANHDPIFFKVCVGPQIQVPPHVILGDTCVGSTGFETLEVCNTGTENLIVESITSSDPQFSVAEPSSGFPVVVSPDFCFPFEILFTPSNEGPQAATLTIRTNDPAAPPVTVQVTGNGAQQRIVLDPPNLTGPFAFPSTVVDPNGDLGCFSEETVLIRNTGTCTLEITNIFADPFSAFEVTTPTVFPITLPPGEEPLPVTVRFAPNEGGGSVTFPDETMGALTVASNDPRGDVTGELCGEAVVQSGVRVLVVDNTGNPIDEVDSLTLISRGIHKPIRIRMSNVSLNETTLCGKNVRFHLNREDLPPAGTTGANPKSSYVIRVREGGKWVRSSFSLGQCEFKEFVLKLR